MSTCYGMQVTVIQPTLIINHQFMLEMLYHLKCRTRIIFRVLFLTIQNNRYPVQSTFDIYNFDAYFDAYIVTI